MPQITANELTRIAKDTFYVGVGLGVIGVQKAQVQRVELTKAVEEQAGEARGQLERLTAEAERLLTELRTRLSTAADTADDRVRDLEARLDAVELRLESLLDEIEAKLPEQAREVVAQARTTARDARQQARETARDARTQVRKAVAA